MPKQKIIGILGGGKFGTALARRFHKNCQVKLYERSLKIKYKKIRRLEYFQEMKELQDSDLIIIAVPSFAIREVIKKFNLFYSGQPVLGISKGIEKETGLLPSQIVKEIWPKVKYAHLSGPSFATDVLEGRPVVVSLGLADLSQKKYFKEITDLKDFKVEVTQDLIGVQLGGALKNITAVIAGMADGLSYGRSFQATLILEGLREMISFGQKLGAKKETFFGPAGLGDLILTATSPQSRNYQLGIKLVENFHKKLNKMIKKETFEGVTTCAGAHHLAKKLKIKLPIIEGVYQVIYKNKDPKKVLIEIKNEIFR